jgi:hypothetical protein
MSLKVNGTLAAAGAALFLVSLSPVAFAQAGPATTSCDTAGTPGTEAPASPAPISKISRDWMSHENSASTSNSQYVSSISQQQIAAEERARLEEARLVREIILARMQRHNADAAARNQWLGSISLARGNRAMAENYFRRAEADLRANVTTAHHTDALSLASDPDAVNMHPNDGVMADY